MRTLRILHVVLLFVCLFQQAQAKVVRVASFNVRNYNVCDRMVDGEWRPDYPKPEEEKRALREIIRAVGPDVLVMQEMGGPEFLEELRLDLLADGADYPYKAHLAGADPDRCLCALSKLPFAEVRGFPDLEYSLRGRSETVKRGLLAVTFETQGVRWTVYNVHLKSRYGDDDGLEQSRLEREAEATRIRDVVDGEALAGGSLWLLAGDLNTTPGTGAYGRMLRKTGRVPGVDLRPVDSAGEVWTYYYKARDTYERIDVLLSSPGLAESVVDGSGRVFDGSQALTASDHRMIYVDIEFSEDGEK
jgi:endonuclease/exonuclease/phosphatase family metal-dependent hydrolase